MCHIQMRYDIHTYARTHAGLFHGKRIHCVGDAVAATVTGPLLEVLLPADASVKMRTLTRAMLASAMSWVAPSMEVLENERILVRGGSTGDGWITMPEIDVLLAGDEKGIGMDDIHMWMLCCFWCEVLRIVYCCG
jgi:hypothetical protein